MDDATVFPHILIILLVSWPFPNLGLITIHLISLMLAKIAFIFSTKFLDTAY